MMQLIERTQAFLKELKGHWRNVFRGQSWKYGATNASVRITLMYLIIGVAWILLSDKLVLLMTDDLAQFTFYQMLKGWFYVLLTAIFLFIMIQKQLTKFEVAQSELSLSYDELETTHEELVATEEELRDKLYALDKSKTDLTEIEERYRLAIEGANDGIWDWDIEKNTFFFDRTKTMLGYETDAFPNVQDAWFSLVHPEDLPNIQTELDTHLNNNTPYYRSTYRVRAKNGKYRWILSRGQSISDREGNLIRMAGSHTDITETRDSQEKIQRLAYFDHVTGLYNRFYFMEQFEIDIDLSLGLNRSIGIILLDIDNFKKTIDTLGHSYGDLLLQKIGAIIKSCIGKSGTLYRFGGDEFVIEIKDIASIKDIVLIAERILACLHPGISIRNYESFVTASMGIAAFPQHGNDVETILKNAEVAMYEAKLKGKNGYHLFNDKLKNNFIEHALLENELRHAIEKEELVLHYQPKIDLKNHEIVGGEALVRWMHPIRGMIPPIEFISIAEDNGMIRQLGQWVIQEACRQNKEWQNQGLKSIPIAVNISAKQFQQKDLVKAIKMTLHEMGLAPEWLEIEVTESIAMQDLKYTIKVLEELRKMKISISLDDFGTGYSSLNYLKHLPIDTVKIDKSFVHDMCESSSQSVIADAIIMMAHGMDLTVTAEGIETLDQLTQLKMKSCDFAQGYYFYKPVPADQFATLLKCHPYRQLDIPPVK